MNVTLIVCKFNQNFRILKKNFTEKNYTIIYISNLAE